MKFVKNGEKINLYNDADKLLSTCTIHEKGNVWTISAWFTAKDELHKGFGKMVMREAVRRLLLGGKPARIEYIWNGANAYVYDWMVSHFDAKNTCPLAILKMSDEDSWESHVYDFNVNKFLAYYIN